MTNFYEVIECSDSNRSAVVSHFVGKIRIHSDTKFKQRILMSCVGVEKIVEI